MNTPRATREHALRRPEHVVVLRLEINLVNALNEVGKLDEAGAILTRSLASRTQKKKWWGFLFWFVGFATRAPIAGPRHVRRSYDS